MKLKIELQPFQTSDFERFISWIPDPKFMFMFAGTAFTFPVTHGQLVAYISLSQRKAFKVIEVDSGRVIGHAELNNINSIHKNARICRILIGDENDRNKGYGQQIIRALLQIGFDELNLHRLDLGVFDFNKQAIACYEKCGLKIEGLLRDTFLIGGEFHSVYNMSILQSEWNQMIRTNKTQV